MTWTNDSAEIISITKDKGLVIPIVRFTDPDTGETIEQDFRADDIDMDRLKNQVRKRIASLQTRDTAASTLVVGKIDLSESKPSEDEKSAVAFFDTLYALNDLNRLVEKGLMKPDDPDIQAKMAEIKQGLSDHPEYAKDSRFR